MSVNLYNAETNELELLAGASEIPRWSGTQAQFNVLDKSTLADGTIIEITDDLSNIFSTWTGTSAEFEALDKSTLADGCYINITDDEMLISSKTQLTDAIVMYRLGKMRTIQITKENITLGDGSSVIIPEGDRPSHNLYFPCNFNLNGQWVNSPYVLFLTTNGNFYLVQRGVGAKNIAICETAITYYVD